MGTIKQYYKNPFQSKCKAKIVSIDGNIIEIDKTIAFPKGGGQEGDKGTITLTNGKKINFEDCKKIMGRTIFLNDFPSINVDTVVEHIVCEKDLDLLKSINIGEEVEIEINTTRREKLSTSHTACHLLYIGVLRHRPSEISNIIGCHITENSARLDFFTNQNFINNDIKIITDTINDLIDKNLKIITYPHKEENEALFWECNGIIIPCGGTHLTNTGSIGNCFIKRKNIGSGKERLIIKFANAKFDITKYS